MSRLIWLPSGLSDVQRLYRFLAEKDKEAARRAVGTIRMGVKVLAQNPEIGRTNEAVGPDFREWLIDFGESGYVVLYHFDGDTAAIYAVRHQRELEYSKVY